MKRTVNNVAFEAVKKFISESEQYTVEQFLKDQGYWGSADTSRHDDFIISCPFHRDSSPSFHYQPSSGKWHCFSCNRGGSYLNLVDEFNKEILRNSISFYHMVNNILLSDKKMSLLIGFATIFSKESEKFVGNYKRPKFVPRKTKSINSYIQLANEMNRQGLNSFDQIALAILHVQDGYSPDEILGYVKASKKVEGEEVSTPMSTFNINEILDTLG